MSSAPALVLFDIDGTLIRRAGPHHRQALVEAVYRVTGHETSLDNVDTSGMLDSDLIRILLRDAGLPQSGIRLHMSAIIEKAQKLYVRSCPDLQRKVCPGVRMLLRRLQRRSIPAGLVTGNLPAIAWRKMRQAGIDHYFRVGAFAGMASTRAGLVRTAIRQAQREGIIGKRARVTLIGDHPNDVQAAKLNGIQAIAVGTGICGEEALVACYPDLIVRDMRSLPLDLLL